MVVNATPLALGILWWAAWPAHAQDISQPATTTASATTVSAPVANPAPTVRATGASTTAPTPQKLRNERLKAAIAKLRSIDPDAMRQALEALVEVGGEPAAVAVSTRLREGLPPQVIEQAIDSLVMLGRPNVGPVLLELTLHRRATVRERAVTAIGVLKIRSAQSALLYCLDDPSPDVRSAAVMALGDIGDQRSLSALFSAADHGADKALESVGKIMRPQQVKLLFGRAGSGDVTPILPALNVLMNRTDFPLAGKLDVINTLATIASPSARTLLVQWLDAWKTTGHPRLRKALFDGLKRIDQGAPQPVSARTSTTTVATETPATVAKPALPAPLPPAAPATPATPAAPTTSATPAATQTPVTP